MTIENVLGCISYSLTSIITYCTHVAQQLARSIRIQENRMGNLYSILSCLSISTHTLMRVYMIAERATDQAQQTQHNRRSSTTHHDTKWTLSGQNATFSTHDP